MTYQDRVYEWLLACFGEEISQDKVERNHRFLEEALETVQSGGCTRSEAHQLVDYVFNRPIGELGQEVGGALVCLAALCSAHGRDMAACGETELSRIWTKVEQIRAKQAAKPKHSPLPEAAHLAAGEAREGATTEKRKVYKGSTEDAAYIRARFADRGLQTSFDYDGHRWCYQHTSFDDAGEYDLLWRPTPAATVPPAGAMDSGTLEKLITEIWASTFVSHPYSHGDTWVPEKRAKAALRIAFRALGGPANG